MVKQKQKKKRTHTKLKIALAIFLVFIFLIIAMFIYINSPKVQAMIYNSVNKVSSLKIESAKLHLDIFKRQLTISDLVLYSPTKKQRFTSEKVSLNFSLLPLFKGSIHIHNLKIARLKIDLGEGVERITTTRKKLGLANLLLIRNLTLKNGVIDGIEVNAPRSKATAKKIEIDFDPSIWGSMKLFLKLDSPEFKPEGKPALTVSEIDIKGVTDVNNWIDYFPYVDDLTGSIDLKEFKWKNLDVETLKAKLAYSGKKINLKSLTAMIGGHKVDVDGTANGNTKKYSLNINIPEPVYLPQLGRETSFMDTSGSLKGKIKITGTGLDYKTTNATADLSLSHTVGRADPLPANLTGQINISGGSMSIMKATLKVGDYPVAVRGSFNYVKPNLNLSFEGDNIPVETVLNRFQDDKYHPTKGVAKVVGKFSGWKPNLKFDLSVDAAPASYHGIVVDRAKIELDVTYNQLNLIGQIYEEGKETGTVDLKMTMGGKLADGTRQKKFTLNAKVTNQDLTKTMAEYDLKGIGNGTLTISGAPKSYSGSAKLDIENGNFKGIGFVSASTDIKFATRKLTFDNMKIATSATNPSTFPNPLFMDITDYGVRVHGEPRTGLTIDAKYMSGSGQWQISKVSYASLNRPDWVSTLSGTVGREGGLNLKVKGTFDTSLLTYLRGLVREATGPAELNNIHIGGTSENPSLSGSISLEDNTAQVRGWGYYVDKIYGTFKLSGHTISIPRLTGRIEYGDFDLTGSLSHQNKEISNAKIDFKGNSIRYATSDRAFRMEFDCDLKFAGTPNSSKLAGNISIIDGRYTKNFSIFEKMKAQPAFKEDKIAEKRWKNIKLDLKIKSTGDLKIDNNIGEIWLSTDLTIRGTAEKPNFIGNVETVDGEIHYAGLNFDVTRGFVEFRDPYTIPYIEFNASKEVGNYNVILTVRGRTNKLYLDLNSTPPLDRKDILALLTFGVTQEEIEQARFGYQLGTGLVAEQVGAILQAPIRKLTPIDRFRLEASPRGSDITRLNLGKDISDRMRIYFITDISTAEAIQTFQAEYAITDFLLLKGSSSTDSDYHFNLTFRFRER